MATALLAFGRAPTRIDPDWPPVLIVAVLGAVSAMALSIVVVLRRLRAEVRAQGREGRTR
jgi:hypothetical protein